MSPRNPTSLVVIASALWISVTWAANEPMPTEGARNLVRATKLGEFAILAAQMALADNPNPDAQSDPLPGCMRKIKPGLLVDDLAPELDAQLTPPEIEQAEQFFSQAVGQRLINLGLRDLRRKIEKKPQLPVLRSTQEAREIDAFVKTSAGTKLLTNAGLSRASFGEQARAHIREIANKCAHVKWGRH
jgi:hypothetical protein